jgi:hypothetical protein
MIIRLEWREIIMAAEAAVIRRVHAEANNWKHHNSGDRAGVTWDNEITGTIAEMAACKMFGEYWSAAVDPGAADTKRTEIRSSTNPHSDLIIRSSDEPKKGRPFTLAIVTIPNVEFVGWIIAREGMRKEWYQARYGRPPCFWVPRSCLRPMETLPKEETNGAGEGTGDGAGNNQSRNGGDKPGAGDATNNRRAVAA